MIIELGHFALILAAMVAVVQTVLPLIGAWRGMPSLMAVAEPASLMQFLLVACSFGALTYGFVVSDFSLRLVWMNSHSAKPMLYKISGVWGNHEGSMLLWVLIVALFGACAGSFGSRLPPSLRARVLAVQASIAVAFYGFILFTSNPFLRLAEPPLNGKGLNPLLQDPGLAFHPPFLYLGYVGLSMSFSFAVAALLEGRVDAAWGRWVRPWTLASWVFLTVGIALGSWWAYYELGWGGFWFWDPVENASLMPWLLAAALLHSAVVVEKRESLKSWTILLAILAFGFSLLGTFIVRSGVLTSVHAFASDPARGVFILSILALFLGGALVLFALRAQVMQGHSVFALVSRESALILNNILLASSAFVVFIGTMWPLVAEMLFDRTLSVGPPFFNTAVTPLIFILAVLLPPGSLLAWKRGNLRRAASSLWPAAIFGLVCGALSLVVQGAGNMYGILGIILGAWIIAGSLLDLRARTGRGGLRARAGRLRRMPGADWGRFLAHAGFGVTMVGIAAISTWAVEDIRAARPNDPYVVAGWQVVLRDVERVEGPNFEAVRATVEMQRGGDAPVMLYPEKRFYPVEGMPTTEAGLSNGFWRDLYVVIGDQQDDGSWAIRIYIKPLANWIWSGALLMALGGVLSLLDRRLRIGAGARSAAR